MIRRLNYTGRKRILREHAEILLSTQEDGNWTFAASLRLGTYGLPTDAPVVVEAYRQTTWRRFDFGNVEHPVPNDDCSLSDFGTAQGVKFRVKVVDCGVEREPRSPAKILALADRILPQRREGRQDPADSLLAVDWGEDDEFRHHPWRLQFGEDSEPLLRVSKFLIADRDAFVRSPHFISLVAPELLRSILVRILLVDKFDIRDGGGGSRTLWVLFASALPGMRQPPSDDSGEIEEWIDRAAVEFSRQIDVRTRFASWWAEDERK